MSFSNESYRQSVEAYIQSGGKITICPTKYALGAVPLSRKDTPRRPDWMMAKTA